MQEKAMKSDEIEIVELDETPVCSNCGGEPSGFVGDHYFCAKCLPWNEE